MSSPATLQRTFINMSSTPISPIDLTISPMSISPMSAVIIISDTEDEIDPSHNRNNSNYRLNDNNNLNSSLGFDNQNIQNIFNSSRHSNNNQVSSSRNTNHYNRSRLAYSTNGDGSSRNNSTRSGRAQRSSISVVLNLTVSSQANNNSHRHRPSAFHPYDIRYGNSSSGSSRTIPPPFEPVRTNTNTNTNDVQLLNTPPPSSSRRRTNNSPKPTTLAGHARDLDDSHILVCADCNELLHEKLWALSNCGHVICGSCVDKYLEKKRFVCPSCKKTTKPTTLLQLYV